MWYIVTGGNCHTLMIANIWGEAAQMEETVSEREMLAMHNCLSTIETFFN